MVRSPLPREGGMRESLLWCGDKRTEVTRRPDHRGFEDPRLHPEAPRHLRENACQTATELAVKDVLRAHTVPCVWVIRRALSPSLLNRVMKIPDTNLGFDRLGFALKIKSQLAALVLHLVICVLVSCFLVSLGRSQDDSWI